MKKVELCLGNFRLIVQDSTERFLHKNAPKYASAILTDAGDLEDWNNGNDTLTLITNGTLRMIELHEDYERNNQHS
jgi:hypothetical protein